MSAASTASLPEGQVEKVAQSVLPSTVQLNVKGGQASGSGTGIIISSDGEILTNNSEDGPVPNALGRQLRWDVGATSAKIPEALIRLQ